MTRQTSFCQLCKCEGPLELSHILPALVYRWQKRTSSTGFLRFGREVNRRAQDGLKTKFLCRECEQRLSQWETKFANKIFYPYHNNQRTNFGYAGWLPRFCISISWRILTYMRDNYPRENFERKFQKSSSRALSVWKGFLLGDRRSISKFEQHLIPLGPIASADGNLPQNFHRYLMRCVEADIIFGEQQAVTFAKLGHILLLGFVSEPKRELWRGTKVNISGGSISPSRLDVPDWLCQTLVERSNRLAELESQLTQQQHEKIENTQMADRTRTEESETMHAHLLDATFRSGS